MRTFNKITSRLFASVTFTSALALAACGGGVADSQVQFIDRTTQGLTLGSLLEVNGTYGAGCTERTGAWSIGISGFTALDNEVLSVIKNDAGCVLSVTGIRVGSEMGNTLYAAASSLALSDTYSNAGIAFRENPMDPVAFYSNARLTPDATFGSNFTVQVLYSDDSSQVSASKNATYEVKTASASSSNVTPPDYTIDMSGLALQVDADKIVQGASGSVVLNDGMVGGQNYVVTTTDLGASPSYAAVDAAFTGGTVTAISGLAPSIPNSAFSLTGLDLTSAKKRYLIVSHEVSGTRSYEVFTVTFNGP